MKNPWKRIVPIVLALAVLGCAVWYLLIYDREFTRDVLITQARYFDDEGRHDIAAWFYDLAYAHADNDAAVAIELAEQYRGDGNYTKAEFTLTNAIAKNGTVELYMALSKLFVEQDKLMDAVNMLDKISDPVLKEQLAALRPPVPTVNVTPGFHSEYISVGLSAEVGKLLVSTDREYPSLREDEYAGEIPLSLGENTIFALTVGQNGLVSPLGIYGYVLGGVIEEVRFADPAVEAEVRRVLGAEESAPIRTDELWTITEFTVPMDATVYTDLAAMTNLTSLTLYNAKADQLGFLPGLTKLEKLTVTGCEPDKQTLTAIAGLPALKALTIAQCGLADISPLAAAYGLEYLDLSYNSIRDISAISSMAGLKTLYMGHNTLTDLTALKGLRKLEVLYVSYNAITALDPVCSLPSLRELSAGNNQLAELGDLDNLSSLTKLDVSYNKLRDISVLAACPELVDLNIAGNSLTDITALAPAKKLRWLNCAYNAITALPSWAKDIALVSIDASYNQITDLSPLSMLQSLNKVNVDYNSGIRSAEPLANCPNLIEVNLFGTQVIDVSMLEQQSIIVNYNPTEVVIPVPEETEPTEAE